MHAIHCLPLPTQHTNGKYEGFFRGGVSAREQVDVSSAKHCLRSAQLRPDYEFSSEPEYDVDLWADIPMINKVVASRARFVTPATLINERDIEQ